MLGLVALGAVGACVTASVASLDGPFVFLPDGRATEYASGYSEVAYRSVHEGMSADEVLRLLGEPVERTQYGNEETWDYSRPRDPSRDDGYRIRRVMLSFGRVRMKHHGFCPSRSWRC